MAQRRYVAVPSRGVGEGRGDRGAAGELEDAGDVMKGIVSQIPLIGPLITGLMGGDSKAAGSEGSKGATGGGDTGAMTALLQQMGMQNAMGAAAAGGKGGGSDNLAMGLLAANAAKSPEVPAELARQLTEIVSTVKETQSKGRAEDAAKDARDQVKSALAPELEAIKGQVGALAQKGVIDDEVRWRARRELFERRTLARLDALLELQAPGVTNFRRY